MRRAVAAAPAILFLVLAAGCAPALHRLTGDEARGARELFAAAAAAPVPIESSFSGVATMSGRAYPFVAGVVSRQPEGETVGFYDPLGGPVLFLLNDGRSVTVVRGSAAGDFPVPKIPPVEAGPVSLARILSGGPGYPAGGGEPGRTDDGEWVETDGPQRLVSDPSRRFLARAEYRFRGKRVAVSYPGRDTPGPPPVVTIEIDGAKIEMRRDEE